MSVRNVLQKASKYSDGGSRNDLPPTYNDNLMRIAHTQDSVTYNLKHCEDHMSELISQLTKLHAADRHTAEELAQKVCKWLDKSYAAVEECKKPIEY
jgi:predicted secreted protein